MRIESTENDGGCGDGGDDDGWGGGVGDWRFLSINSVGLDLSQHHWKWPSPEWGSSTWNLRWRMRRIIIIFIMMTMTIIDDIMWRSSIPDPQWWSIIWEGTPSRPWLWSTSRCGHCVLVKFDWQDRLSDWQWWSLEIEECSFLISFAMRAKPLGRNL